MERIVRFDPASARLTATEISPPGRETEAGRVPRPDEPQQLVRANLH